MRRLTAILATVTAGVLLPALPSVAAWNASNAGSAANAKVKGRTLVAPTVGTTPVMCTYKANSQTATFTFTWTATTSSWATQKVTTPDSTSTDYAATTTSVSYAVLNPSGSTSYSFSVYAYKGSNWKSSTATGSYTTGTNGHC